MTLEDQLRDSAVYLAERGFKVFPIKPNGRTPAVEGWYNFASDDPIAIKRRWQTRYAGHNIGVIGHKNLLILDFDCKKGKKGMNSLDMLRMCGLPEDTFTVRTPSGGIHAYLNVPNGTDITVSADRVEGYPGLDVRCNGGYVIAPGSIIAGGGGYQIENDANPADADPWLLETLRSATKAKRTGETAVVDPDQEINITRAINYLTEKAPSAIEGEGGNETTYRVAAAVKDFGISESACFDLMGEHWNETGKAEPPWDADELAKVIDNAYSYGQSSPGKATAEADFGPPDDVQWAEQIEAQTKAKRRKGLKPQNIRDAAFEAQHAEEDPLVFDLLDRGAMSVMYGTSNVGKSFVALDVAFAIATGRTWLGADTYKGSVLYVAAEGGRRFKRRLQAILKHQPTEGHIPFELIDEAIDLRSDDAHMKALIAICNDIKNVELIVIDTLSRALSGGDENSSVDMGKLVSTLDIIRQKTGAHLMVVHHSGKDQARGARGHSLLRAATDTELELSDQKELWVRKQRDLEQPIDPFRFKLDSTVLKQDGQGRDVKSAVVRWLAVDEFEPVELAPLEMRVVHCLMACVAGDRADGEGAVSVRELLAEYCGQHGSKPYASMDKSEQASARQKVSRSRQICVDSGWVEQASKGRWKLTEIGLENASEETSENG